MDTATLYSVHRSLIALKVKEHEDSILFIDVQSEVKACVTFWYNRRTFKVAKAV